MVPFYVFLFFVLLPLSKLVVAEVVDVVVVDVVVVDVVAEAGHFRDQDQQATGAFLPDPVAPVISHPAR